MYRSSCLVPLVKDPITGSMVIRIESSKNTTEQLEEKRGEVISALHLASSIHLSLLTLGVTLAVGGRAVHKQLLALQHQLLWRMVATTLESEARKSSGKTNFSFCLAEKVLEAVASNRSSLQLSAFRALILEHLTLCR